MAYPNSIPAHIYDIYGVQEAQFRVWKAGTGELYHGEVGDTAHIFYYPVIHRRSYTAFKVDEEHGLVGAPNPGSRLYRAHFSAKR